MDWEQARFNMIEQQIRPWDVSSESVLQSLMLVKREAFVPSAYHDIALTDMALPLDSTNKNAGACMWEPKMEARVLQELALRPVDTVLEIGTGSGYFTALLSHFVHYVTTVEIDVRLAELARTQLHKWGARNVDVVQGDGANGWGASTYDVIVVTGSYPQPPIALFEQLKHGGRLFAVIGDAPAMTATLYTKHDNKIQSRQLFETVIAPLTNAPQPERFSF